MFPSSDVKRTLEEWLQILQGQMAMRSRQVCVMAFVALTRGQIGSVSHSASFGPREQLLRDSITIESNSIITLFDVSLVQVMP